MDAVLRLRRLPADGYRNPGRPNRPHPAPADTGRLGSAVKLTAHTTQVAGRVAHTPAGEGWTGTTLWLRWKTLSGSYSALIVASRS